MTSRVNSSRAAMVTYAFLLAATALSWQVGQGRVFHHARDAGTVILVIAFVKIRTVILNFMEIGDAPIVFRIASEIWVFAVCLVLILLYR